VTFLSHFVLCLAISAGAFFAYQAGIPQMVAANDVARWFGGAIGLLFVWTAVWLGWQAWRADIRWTNVTAGLSSPRFNYHPEDGLADASFGHLVQLLCPAIGMLGTVVGLSLAFKDAGSPEMFKGATTAFFSTGVGITAMILVMVLTANLESGIRRARR
jgi:threonine/homoserine/homoserine lactone efflux protein